MEPDKWKPSISDFLVQSDGADIGARNVAVAVETTEAAHDLQSVQ
jgi:hypothetical protein